MTELILRPSSEFPKGRITDYLSADDLLRSGMVNQAQHEHLKGLENAEKREHLLRQAERLRAQAEKAREDAEKLEAAAVSA